MSPPPLLWPESGGVIEIGREDVGRFDDDDGDVHVGRALDPLGLSTDRVWAGLAR